MEKAKYFGDKRSNHDWTIMLFQKKAPKECDGMRLPLSKYGRKRVVCGKEDALRQGQVRMEQCAVMTQEKNVRRIVRISFGEC